MTKTQYAPVITLHEGDSQYDTALAMIERGDYAATVEFLAQWEHGDRLAAESWVDFIPDTHGIAEHGDDFYSYNLVSWHTPKGMQDFDGTITIWRIHELGCINPHCEDAPHWRD